jgi:uncharacterized SAM-binding protein YcdF (DUF218 family)
LTTAIVVPGHGLVGDDGVHRISTRCLDLVAEAERLAASVEPELVLFTGWSSTGGPSEAEQMKLAWDGPAVELVAEPTARTTAENASRSLALLLERGIGAAIVVCTPLHLARARLFFGRLYRANGLSVSFRVARVRPSLRAAVWELSALPLVPFQLRAAQADVARGRR